ncbi:NAD(P)H-dependent glycerol-3-phosphate dehydrogenase [Salsuginibacillus kocurii]|uniref:NAD(P)H-dependent glycerol-3-phosphate dehydrogenase n=1 Tax=Salsuginibacillus kocurii TaxID=427078 RepID=UPI000379BD36|nr:NAD(P)H-dependent glycerol-3-phosphate dehydrogenase [Salsuginibacillus kocurii]
MSTKVAVIGAGSWGTALALVLADNNYDVRLWSRRTEHAEAMQNDRENKAYLAGCSFSDNIVSTADMSVALAGVDVVVIVVPTKGIRETVRQIDAALTTKPLFIHATKGIEPASYKRISEMIQEEASSANYLDICVLSGPSHAEEVGMRQPTTVTVAANHAQYAGMAQNLFMNQNFRVYTNPDLIGVELGGALKNIIALGVGVTDGLGFGDNAKAALMTRGLAEIARLGEKLGAQPKTFSGLAGLGDLIVTCTSTHSRNFRCGRMLGNGASLDKVLDEMGMVVEGVRTTEAVTGIARDHEVDMPITNMLADVLFSDTSAEEAVEKLMGRVRKNEVEDPSPFSFGQVVDQDSIDS